MEKYGTEANMTQKQYIFNITRFICGCVYRTAGDTAVFCPTHRTEPHQGVIQEQETVHTPTADPPDIPGLVMNSHYKTTPHVLRNDSRNSIHTTTSVQDGDGHEWSEPQEDEVGICAACYIDREDCYETRIAMCECGDERCSYRWCGALTGLHAYWRLHTQGKSEETTGIPEVDIFSYGKFQEQTEAITETLNEERISLEQEIEKQMQDMETVREQKDNNQPDDTQQAIYLMPWLDTEYLRMKQPNNPNAHPEIARTALRRKIARLHIIGALPPTPA